MHHLLGLSSNKSPYDSLVEKATSDKNTSEDWQSILEINDRVAVEQNGPKDCIRSIINRLYSEIPWVIIQTLTLLDSLASNCGKRFHLEICSRDFETELVRLIRGGKNIHPKVSENACLLLKKWAQTKEFKNDPQLNLIPSLYDKLKSEGISFHSSDPSKRKASEKADYANVEEEANLAKAIELSIQEAKKRGIKTDTTTSSSTYSTTNSASQSFSNSSSLYPSFDLSEMNNSSSKSSNSKSEVNKEPIKVRALYDFEAAEDNELTFKAGEIILVSDSSDTNWWKGSNHRGEGLFPANFVSTDLNSEPENFSKTNETKKVQFNEEVKVVKVEKEEIKPEDVSIDEEKIDQLLSMIQDADPKSFTDSDELLRLEEQCMAMMPLIDRSMEDIDRCNANLTSLNQQLNSALNLYHDLMKESMIIEQLNSLQIQQPVSQYPPQYQMINGGGGLMYDPNQTSTQASDAQSLPVVNAAVSVASNYYTPQSTQAGVPITYDAAMAVSGPTNNLYQSPSHHPTTLPTAVPQSMMSTQPQNSTPNGVNPSGSYLPYVKTNTNTSTPPTATPAAVPNLL